MSRRLRGRRRAKRSRAGNANGPSSIHRIRILAATAARPYPRAPACHAACLRYAQHASRHASVVTLRACHAPCLAYGLHVPRQSLR